MEIWTPKAGDDILYLRCEDGNEIDKYAVTIMIGGQTGAHIPKKLTKIFKLFLALPNFVIKCKVLGKTL